MPPASRRWAAGPQRLRAEHDQSTGTMASSPTPGLWQDQRKETGGPEDSDPWVKGQLHSPSALRTRSGSGSELWVESGHGRGTIKIGGLCDSVVCGHTEPAASGHSWWSTP